MTKQGTARKETPSEKLSDGRAIPGGNALPALDRLIHERMRLGIVSSLAANRSLTFNELKKLLKTTDGNLSVHARKLEDASYIACTKSFQGRMPKTEYRLTEAGRRFCEPIPDALLALDAAFMEGIGTAEYGTMRRVLDRLIENCERLEGDEGIFPEPS